MVDGELWVEQRRFILRHLRDFGFGRTDMAVQIEFESAQLVKYYTQLITEKAIEFSPEKTTTEVTLAPCSVVNRNNKNGRIYQLESDDLKKNVDEGEEESAMKGAEKEEPSKKSLTAEDFYMKVGDDLEIRKAAKVSGIIVEMEDFFGVPVLNALWCMMAGKRYFIVFFFFRVSVKELNCAKKKENCDNYSVSRKCKCKKLRIILVTGSERDALMRETFFDKNFYTAKNLDIFRNYKKMFFKIFFLFDTGTTSMTRSSYTCKEFSRDCCVTSTCLAACSITFRS